MPTLKVAKTLWGVDEAADTGKWDALFARIKAEGFDGVEAIALTWRADPALFTSLLTKHGLALICQIHTTGGDIVDGEYVYCSSCKLEDHIASFKALTLSPTLASPTSQPQPGPEPGQSPNPDKTRTLLLTLTLTRRSPRRPLRSSRCSSTRTRATTRGEAAPTPS